MKVILVNGSPHHNGCTFTALSEIEKELSTQGIETEMFWIGIRPISGCMGCNQCLETGLCCMEDSVNLILAKAVRADRAFYGKASLFANKPAAAIASCRRAGSTSTFDQLNKYFTISNMPVVSSNYWNGVHGTSPEEVMKDIEGLQTMRILGRNMAWLLKCIEAGKRAGITPPPVEARKNTNFIR